MQQVIETDFATALQMALTALGVGFLVANGWILFQFIQYFRYRKTALVTWPTQKPPHYPFLLGLGLVFGILVVVKLVVQQRAPIEAFGEGMLLLYYGYLWPMTFRIGRGLYEDGIWTDSRFVPYSQIGGLSWREDPGDHARDHLPSPQPGSTALGAPTSLWRGPPAPARQDRDPRLALHHEVL